jgi:Kef-type K+ transport system membrane component KefB
MFLLVVFTIKFGSGFLVARFSGMSLRSSMAIGVSVSTVAEFSMVLAAKGYQLNLVTRSQYLHMLAVIVFSFAAAPIVCKMLFQGVKLETYSPVKDERTIICVDSDEESGHDSH